MDVHYTLRQLQYFVAVAQTGTMSAAAVRCHVSQSALSLAISQLERSLGVKLFIRQRAKGAELTPAGVHVLQLAEQLLRQAGELQDQVEVERGTELTGTLPVGCYTTLAPRYIPPLLTEFKTEAPGVALEFSENAQPELLRELHDGTLELALLYDFQLDADIDYVQVDELLPHVLLPANHRFADAEDVSLAELANEPMILFDVPPSRENWTQIVRDLDIELTVAHRTSSSELARCLVGRGVGYAPLFQVPSIDVTYEGYVVVAKPIREPIEPLRVVLGYPADTNLTARARRFAEFAVTILRGLPAH